MKHSKSFVAGVALLVAFALCAPAVAADDVTVGDFVLSLARAKGLTAASVGEAKASLESAGITLPVADFDRTLTQGDVVAIGNAAGLHLSSSTPEAPFTGEQVSAFLVSLAPELGATDGDNTTDGAYNDNGADPRTKGKGKKKGLFRSPSSPN
jgi:hypothetical protein